MGKLDGKVAIITGGASGIGLAMAQLFSEEGAKVIIADYNGEGGEATAQDLQAKGGQASAVRTNVADKISVRDMVNHTLDTFGRIDILVNNAGIGSPPVPIHAVDHEDWERVIGVCLTGVFLGMKYAIPQMMEQNSGNIINVASIAGIIGSPRLSPYAAAKAGVIELTKVAAVEYARYNIRCNALAPGWTHTPMVEAYIGGDPEMEKRMLQGVPQRRFADPSEIAHAALFLASDDARFVHGHTLVLDGGITIV